MAAEHLAYVVPRERLHRHFATRVTTTDPRAWRAQAWVWATLVLPGSPDEDVAAFLDTEWASFRRRRPEEPHVTFAPPEAPPEEPIVPGPPPYDELAPLRFGRYGSDHLPSHDERVREEQERLAKRDQAFYGF